MEFTSPIGELHFSIIPLLFHEIFYLVSVPYRGATFLNGILENLRKLKSNSFRPLSGSYISQLSGRINEREDTVFPSPIGELHFSMNLAAEVKKLREEVSVPYRGATFLNEMREHLKISRAEFSFPSPIGELHFSIARTNLIDARSELVSVPYRGATFLNMTTKINSALNEGFRPLSGSYISQWCCYVFCQISVLRFRPLSGSYISQLRSKM